MKSIDFSDILWIGYKPDKPLKFSEKENPLDVLNKRKNDIVRDSHSFIFRKKFFLEDIAENASIVICGLGIYTLYINGVRINADTFSPLITEYNKRVIYDRIDITRHLKPGENAVTAELGGGYYSPAQKYWSWRMCWLGDVRLAAAVYGEYKNKTPFLFKTDETWKTKKGGVTENCIYDGTTVDARLYDEGYTHENFDDSLWKNASVLDAPAKIFTENTFSYVRVCAENLPVSCKKIDKLNTVYSFAENRTGRVKIGVFGKSGDKITITHAERLFPDGTLNTESNRDAKNTDTYILKGGKAEYFTAEFTFHGFMHIMCEKSSPDIEILYISQQALSFDMHRSGSFCCFNKDIDRLHTVCVRTMQNSYFALPLDCPQRDERLGWLGDAYTTSVTSLYNFNMRPFYKKWLDDVRLGASPEGEIQHISPRSVMESSADFSSGYLIILKNYYDFYKDRAFLKKHYRTAAKYVDFLLSKSDGFLLPRSRYGDWSSCEPDFVRGDPFYTNTLYLYYDLRIMYEFSDILGNIADTEKYKTLLTKMKDRLLSLYYKPAEHIFGDGSLFSTSFSLLLGLVPDKDKKSLAKRLSMLVKDKDYCLYTGIFGTKFVIDALCLYGFEADALKVITNKKYPGWLYMIKNSTTLTERWDGVSDSLNHGMFSSVDAQLYKILGGIRLERKNNAPIIIKPYFSDLSPSTRCETEIAEGKISVCWIRKENCFSVYTDVPKGCNAEFVLHKDFSEKSVFCNGKELSHRFMLPFGKTELTVK